MMFGMVGQIIILSAMMWGSGKRNTSMPQRLMEMGLLNITKFNE